MTDDFDLNMALDNNASLERRIEALTAENARLREALESCVAELADIVQAEGGDDSPALAVTRCNSNHDSCVYRSRRRSDDEI